MTQAFLLEYIPRKMRKMGYGDKYDLSFASFQLGPGVTGDFSGYNMWYYFPADLLPDDVVVQSNFGCCWNGNASVVFQVYEHTGKITIENKSGTLLHVPFWVVVPYYPDHPLCKCQPQNEKDNG